MYRQAVISIYKQVSGVYEDVPAEQVLFRQPFHNMGYALEFNFTKSYFMPFSDCVLAIKNPSERIIESMEFDPQTYQDRPKVIISAGESYFKPRNRADIPELVNSLPVVYEGHPYYASEGWGLSSKTFTVNLSDMSAPDSSLRVDKYYRAGTALVDVIRDLFSKYSGGVDLSGFNSTDSIPDDIKYTGLNLISQVLPEFSKQYGFSYRINHAGIIVLETPEKKTVSAGPMVSKKTGMIGYPAKDQWIHYKVKTFFGRPGVFYPGQWIEIDYEGYDFGVKNSLIVSGSYNFVDKEASIDYTVSPTGNPVATSVPILKI